MCYFDVGHFDADIIFYKLDEHLGSSKPFYGRCYESRHGSVETHH